MRKYIIAFVLVVGIAVNAFADNKNKWYPDPDIPNIYLVELYTFNGLPKNTRQDREVKILVNHGYAVGYSENLMVPLYAVYRYGNLNKGGEQAKERSFERPPKFQVDLRTKARVHTNDYTGAGFDRGHMAPNSGIRFQYGQLAQLETFLMSNIVPQHESVNRIGKPWQDAEKKEKELSQDDKGTEKSDDDVKDLWVTSGPIFEGDTKYLENKRIGIPSGFYKIIVRRNSYGDSSAQAIAIYIPHFPKPGEKKVQFVTVDEIEERTGFDFHPNLIDSIEDNMEKTKRGWDWKKID